MIARPHRIEHREAVVTDDSHHAVISLLQRGVGEIDRTFADVGGRFGESLELFDGLKKRLLTLADELAHPELAQSRQKLERLAEELPRLESRLGEEKAALTTLHARSESVGQVFIALRARMRLVAILTQRARIERASIRGATKDLEAFTDEVVALSFSARQSVEDCATRHSEVALLIRVAMTAQAEFEDRFGSSLSGLAAGLTRTLAELGTRQGRSIDAINDMVEHSTDVVAATGNAVMALQSGDNIRQRIEHAITALDLADMPVASLRPALFSLEAAQLQATAELLKTDCGNVDDALEVLGDKTGRLVSAVRGMLGGANAHSSTSLVTELEAGLTKASTLLQTCEDDRRTVDETMTKLTGFLEGFESTVAALRKKAVDIVFLGTNAGLRASHIGEGGRSLNVIAKELKIAADMVERDARELGRIFSLMLSASADLRQRTMESGRLMAFEATVNESIGVIGQAGERMAHLLAQLDQEAGQFVVEVESARRAFAAIAGRSREIDQAAQNLDSLARTEVVPATAEERAEAETLLKDRVYPLYSMVAERDIHRTILEQLGLHNSAPAKSETSHEPTESDEEVFEFSL